MFVLCDLASALSRIVNEALRVREEEVVGARLVAGHVPTVPADKISTIVTALNSHLSHLLVSLVLSTLQTSYSLIEIELSL